MDLVHRPPIERGRVTKSAATALEDLRFLRNAVENAGSFTAVPGTGAVLVGGTAVLAGVLAGVQSDQWSWLWIWVAEAGVAALLGITALVRKARAAQSTLLSGPGRRFALSLLPPIATAVAMTVALVQAGNFELLPAMWLLLYGTAVVTGGTLSVRVVTLMGISFMGLGFLSLFAIGTWGNGFMSIGFGGLHIVFGLIIRKRHGG